MQKAYADLKQMKTRFGCDWRTAAFALAVERVARAAELRGL
jgi:glutamate dehydrogenase/leucine dehydrogenase